MGGGGSKRTTNSQSTSQSGSGQSFATPYAINALDEITNVYNANKENLDLQADQARNFAGQLQGNYASAGNAGGAANKFYGGVMNGKYLEGNPYLENIIDASTADITDSVNSQFTLGGRYGSGAHTGVLGDKLGEMEAMLRYGNYNNEMDRMMQAAQGSISADQAKAQAQAAAGQQALAGQSLAAEMPYTGSQSLAQALNALFAGGTSDSASKTVEKSGGGGLLGAAGGALGAAGSLGWAPLASDPALKDDVVKIGEEPDGLGIYEFDYIWGGERQTGVMADEVAELRPWALGPEVGGFATVNYGAL